MTIHALSNVCLPTEGSVQAGKTVVLDGARIQAVLDDTDFDSTRMSSRDLGGRLLVPGFTDVQVNGGGGVLFNDEPNVEGIRAIGRAHRAFGTTGFMVTLITDDLEKVAAGIAAVDAAMQSGVAGLLGIHLEGPFLNAVRKGVHDASRFRVLDKRCSALLTSLQHGKTLITLAPEKATPELIRSLVEAGAIVAAGHSNAGWAETRAALDAGLSGFTHLFNAMSPLSSREPGVVGAALDDGWSYCGLIVDGHHVHPATLRVALKSKRRGACILVTDAMPSVGSDAPTFELDGQTIHVADGRCLTKDGTLAGSDLDMATAVKNASSMLQIEVAEAVRMASQYPADFLGLGSELGRIQPGYRANLVCMDHDLNVVDTWIDGNPQ